MVPYGASANNRPHAGRLRIILWESPLFVRPNLDPPLWPNVRQAHAGQPSRMAAVP